MAGLHIRYNPTLKQYESSTTGTDQGPWTKLDISGNASIPANIAFTNVDNPWTVAQSQIPSFSSIRGPNSLLYFVETAGAAEVKMWRFLSYQNGNLHTERFSGSNVYIGAGPSFMNDGSFSVPADVLANRNLSVGGGQIYFPGTQVPTGVANCLDDYEEGSWTPLLSFGGVVGNTYASAAGSYIKIGRMVHISMVLTLASKAGSGHAYIYNLPFWVTNNGNSYGAAAIKSYPLEINLSGPIAAQVQAATNVIYFYQHNAGLYGHNPLVDTQVRSDSQFLLSCTYTTDN